MVSTLSAALVITAALPWGVSAASVSARQSVGAPGCHDVHIFLARGNNEPYPGRQGKLVAAICAGLDSCDYEDIQYWNPLEAPFCQSVEEGAANGTAQVTAYNKRCPDSKLVLSGYSQGGQVIGDVLGGGGGTFYQNCQQTPNAGLDASKAPGNKISAVLLFGDVRHTANQPYNYLSGYGRSGQFPRPQNQLAGMSAYSSVMRSYCVDSDPVCAGGNTVANHLSYFDVYSGDAGKWVQEVLGKAETTSSSTRASAPSTSASSKPTSTAASSSASSSPGTTTEDASVAPTTAAPTDGASTTGASIPASPTSDKAESTPTPSGSNAARGFVGNMMLLSVTFAAVGILAL